MITAHSTSTPQQPDPDAGCTVADYAREKRLPETLLRTVDVDDLVLHGRPAVRIPYRDEHGVELAVRFRLALRAEPRFRWRAGNRPHVYGLQHLSQARRAGYVLLLASESDVHTAWVYGRPAVAVPGMSAWREDRDAALVSGVGTIYVLLEKGARGDAALTWLARSAIRECVRLFSLDDVQDLNELHLQDPYQFQERLELAMRAAIPWSEHEQVARDRRAESAWDRCEKLARDPFILDRFGDDIERKGLAGERNPAQILYLAVNSRHLEGGKNIRPVSAEVNGVSSAGKSHLTDCVLQFFPQDAFLRLTAQSTKSLVLGTEPIAHRFLVLSEAAGLEPGFATYALRTLLSEGILRYETSVQGPSGRETRTIERAGPTGVLLTTTRITLDTELETRLLSVTVDDSREQTREVIRALAANHDDAPTPEEWHALQIWLEAAEHRVVIPYAGVVGELVADSVVRLRRDFASVLNLVRSSAVLHQCNRERDEHGRIVADLDDYRAVHRLVAPIIAEGTEATLAPSVRETVETVGCNAGTKGVSITELAKLLGIDKAAASRRCKRAESLGYLTNLERRRGRPARISTADPLPDEIELLPSPERVASLLEAPAPVDVLTAGEEKHERPLAEIADALPPSEAEILEIFAEMGARPVNVHGPVRTIETIATGHGITVELVERDLPTAPCRYPAHRDTGRDWQTPDGRTECGICHPPAEKRPTRTAGDEP